MARIFVVLVKVASLISVRSCFSTSGSTLGKNHLNSMPITFAIVCMRSINGTIIFIWAKLLFQ